MKAIKNIVVAMALAALAACADGSDSSGTGVPDGSNGSSSGVAEGSNGSGSGAAKVYADPFKADAADLEPVSPNDAAAVQSVVEDQLSAFKADDFPLAYSHAAPELKNFVPTVERFQTMVQRGYDPIYRSQGHVFGRTIGLNSMVYQEAIITDINAKEWQAVYSLKQQEDGSWKIARVKLSPHPDAST